MANPRMSRAVRAFALGLPSLTFACLDGGGAPSDPQTAVRMGVSALTFAGVADAIWDLEVVNADDDTVIQKRITSSAFGDGAGSATYVAPCDASRNDNTVRLQLVGLYAAPVATPGAFAAAAPANALAVTNPGLLSRDFACVENADVAVDFNVTLLRPANQGFFDIAVDFEDVFCSAKFDCDAGNLLVGAAGARVRTSVLGFACSAGASATPKTTLHLDDLVIDCGPRGVAVIDPSAGPGNLCEAGDTAGCAPSVVDPAGLLQQVAVYRDRELLPGADKVYWNLALALSDGVLTQATTEPTKPPPLLYLVQQVGGQTLVPFGALQANTAVTSIGQGLDLGADSNRGLELLTAPDGTLYGFNTMDGADGHRWGRIDPETGAFTLIGNLDDIFNRMGFMFGEGVVLGFTSNGNLYAHGFAGSSGYAFGRLDTQTGALTALDFPLSDPTSFATAPNGGLFYAIQTGGEGLVPFGVIDPETGVDTPIGPGLDFGTDVNRVVKFVTAPDGTLWAWDKTAGGSPSRLWGRIDTTTGTFIPKGDLNQVFAQAFFGLDPVVGFGSDGKLYAFGFIGSSGFKVVELDPQTGVATDILNPAPYDFATSFATPRQVPTDTGCTLTTRGTVDDGATLGAPAAIAPGKVYPFIAWEITAARCAASSSIPAGGDGVFLRYTGPADTTPTTFDRSFGGTPAP